MVLGWLSVFGASKGIWDKLYRADSDVIYPESFALRQAQIGVIRQMRIGLATYESGAPQVDLARPYTAPAEEVLAAALGEKASRDEVVAFLFSMVPAIRAFFYEAEIEPGMYQTQNISLTDLWAVSQLEGAAPERFELTQEHIDLARELSWDWPHEDEVEMARARGEFPGPSVDGKRPYGDMSYFAFDVHRILEWPVEARDEDGYIRTTNAQDDKADALHSVMPIVVQIMIEQSKIAPGAGW